MYQRQKVLSHIKQWCQEAGALQRKFFRSSSLKISTKTGPQDLVTTADEESERLIIAGIRKHYPDSSILAEESGHEQGSSDYLWVIDPLDGTNNFAHGLPIFAVSIALQFRGQTEVGVVYAPYLDEMYWAIRGEGAFFNDAPIRVSSKVKLEECILATGFPYDKASHPINNIAYFSHLLPKLRGVRRLGAAAYDLCAVASGCLDGYWELNLSPWDVAAGALIVSEAGGTIIPFREDRKVSIIAANQTLAAVIAASLQEVTRVEA